MLVLRAPSWGRSSLVTTRPSLFIAALLAAFSLLAGCGNPTPQPAPSTPSNPAPAPTIAAFRQLMVPYIPQQTQVWCWAASTAMAAAYMKNLPNVTDCEVLTEFDIRNGGPGLCCLTGECVQEGTIFEIQQMLSQIFFINSQVIYSALSLQQVQQYVGQGTPVIAHLSLGGFSGHFVVISGYDVNAGTVTVLDPFFGQYPNIPYSSVLFNPTLGSWDASLVITSPPSSGTPCTIVPQFLPAYNATIYRIVCQY